jgi:hypothetical protein
MTGIPSAKYNPLKQALLDCGPFESDGALRAIFVDNRLKPWRDSLPQASNPAARAEAIMAFLSDKRRADTKENALVLLLHVLSERLDAADECHVRLVGLAAELEETLGEGEAPTRPSVTSSQRTDPKRVSRAPQPDTSKQETPSVAEKKDFFVSYNRADKQWAEWIAWQLEEAGYSTIIQAWDFRPGSNFILDMQRAAEQGRRTIAVLSPDYLKALYTQPEWAAAFAQDPTGEKGTLLPVRVRECKLQGLLSQVVYIDLVGSAEEAAKETILIGVKQGRVKPTAEPGFPGAVEHSVPEQPGFPGESGEP